MVGEVVVKIEAALAEFASRFAPQPRPEGHQTPAGPLTPNTPEPPPRSYKDCQRSLTTLQLLLATVRVLRFEKFQIALCVCRESQ